MNFFKCRIGLPPADHSKESHALKEFGEVVNYCMRPVCRRQTLLAHFGEQVSLTLCSGTCDACWDIKGVEDQIKGASEVALAMQLQKCATKWRQSNDERYNKGYW